MEGIKILVPEEHYEELLKIKEIYSLEVESAINIGMKTEKWYSFFIGFTFGCFVMTAVLVLAVSQGFFLP